MGPFFIIFILHRYILITSHWAKCFAWWRHQMEIFLHYWPFVRGIHWWPVDSPHKGQWRGALMFSLIYASTNSWANNRDAGDLRRHRAHYDVTVMANSKFIGPSDVIWQQKCESTLAWLIPDSIKPLPEPILTYHQWGQVIITWGQFHKRYVRNQLLKSAWKLT